MSTNEEKDKYDFELPVDDDAPKATAPRVHIGGPVCEGCEG